MAPKITVEALIDAPIEKIWNYWTAPEHVKNWNNASDDWWTPAATNDFRVGGKFNVRMESRDGSMGFDFEGTNTVIKTNEQIEYTIADGRNVKIDFIKEGDRYRVVETFEAENQNSIELQKGGWQAILDNFKKYAENQ